MNAQITQVAHSEGNTNPRCRRWCFTLNNYTEADKHILHTCFTRLASGFIIGEEVGESGTPHLQGYAEFRNPMALSALKGIISRTHWEKCKGNRESNIVYCSKEGNVFANTFPPLPDPESTVEERILKRKYSEVEWKPWQQDIIDIVESEPDDRTVYWYWEALGRVGKSFLCKYLSIKYDAIICCGKSTDVFNQLKMWKDVKENKNKSPKLVILDVPRTSADYVCYTAIEKLKDGLVYSGKYEGGKMHLEDLHVVCFANIPPKVDSMSGDRWVIKNIEMNEERIN